MTLRPLIDREVPLPNAASQSIGDMPVAVQQWLDGDIAERIARRSDDSSVEFWNKISAETSRRRRMETPALMSERVMAVLPKKQSKPADLLFHRFKISRAAAVLAALAFVAAGVFAGEYFLH
ncbi:MAG: hypothetical protein ABI120_24080 [Gemmatimonadaceae bacterium]